MALLAAVAVALLVALPLPVLAGANAAGPSSSVTGPHAAVRTPTLAANQAQLIATLPTAMQHALLGANGLPPHAESPAQVRQLLASYHSGTTSAPLAPRPAAPSGNNYFGNPCTTGSTVSSVGGNNSTLVAALSTEYLVFNGSGGSFCGTGSVSPLYQQAGFVETEHSVDRGNTWTSSWLPQNNSWKNIASPVNGSVPGIYFPVANGGPPGWATPSIATANDNTTLLATQFFPGCWLSPGCSNASSSDPAGIAVARSTDGGVSWINTTDLQTTHFFTYLKGTATCNLPANFYLTGAPYSPSVAINPVTDTAIATWEVLGFHIDLGACVEFFSGTVQASVSTNGGMSWSAPVNLTGNSSWNPQIAVGPAPHYDFTVVAENFLNGTVDNSTGAFGANWEYITSTTNGSSWATPVQIGSHGAVNLLWAGSSGPDSFLVEPPTFVQLVNANSVPFTTPGFAVDTSPSSLYSGNQYLVWADNGTSGSADQGVPSIAFEERPAGGASWIGSSTLTPASRSISYFEPAVSVAPDGTVWVTFYGMGRSSGDLEMYAVYSTNGGSTWSSISQITTAASILENGLISIGFENGLAGTSAGAYASWMDCRSLSCTNSANESTMFSLVEPVGFSSSATGVNMTITTNGVAATLPLPAKEAWTVGSPHTIAVPGWLPHNATTVASFVNYTGAVNSTAFGTAFTYSGGASIVANYAYVPGSFIAGFFSPNSTLSRLSIDGYNVTLVPYNTTDMRYNYSVASGRSYYLNASSSRFYLPLTNQIVGTTPGKVTTFNVALPKTHGWLIGKVTPSNATLLMNGTPVTIDAQNGVYNTSAFWGSYWLNATGYGVTNFSQYVTVQPDQSTTTNIVLSGGWIRGALIASYPGLSLKIDGVAVSGLTGATFNVSELGGKHQLVATATGYNTSTINISVVPGHTAPVSVNLTNVGTVIGQVGPTAALKVATLSVTNLSRSGGGPERIDTTTGIFKVNVTGDAYWTVTVKATGYQTTSRNVLVKPGEETAPLTINLNLTPVQQQTCATNSSLCPPSTGNPTSSGLSIELVGGIIVVVVVVAAVAVVLLMRRRGGGGGGSSPPEGTMGGSTDAGESYGESTYGAPPPAQ